MRTHIDCHVRFFVEVIFYNQNANHLFHHHLFDIYELQEICFLRVVLYKSTRYKINSAKIEAANAMIKRIQSKACGIFDVVYLFLKLRQIYYLRLQKQTKMPMSYYRQI